MSYTKIESLVARSKSGDNAAAGELLQLFLPKIYKLSAGIANIDDRQDCVQDLSIAFLQGVKKFDNDQGSPFNAFISKHLSLEMSKWLDGTHKKYNGGRSKKREISLQSPAEDSDDTLTLEDTLEDTAVNVAEQALRHTEGERIKALVFGRDSPLTEKEKYVIDKRFYKDQTITEIAKDSHWQWTTAGKLIERALNKLNRSLIIEKILKNT